MKDFLKGFKNYKMKIEGKSENTTNQYLYRIQSFLEYNNIKTKEDLLSMKANNVKEWLSSLADNGNSERSRNTRLTALKEVYKYASEELKENIDNDILRIPFAKVPKRESKYLDGDTARDLLAFTRDIRVKTGMAIIFATGVRFCELVQITCTDIENGYANIIGKGNKERQIYFPLWVQEIARQFMESKRAEIVEKYGKQNDDTLMLNDNGNKLIRRNFEGSMKSWARKFNEHPLHEGEIDWWEHFSPHKLRHSFGTEQLRNGNDIATVRDELGHSSIATTNNYSHSSQDRVKMAMLGKQEEKETNSKEEKILRLLGKLMENEDLFNKLEELVGDED